MTIIQYFCKYYIDIAKQFAYNEITNSEYKGKHKMADKKKKGFISEFREFINRGSVMDLAVGIVVGGTFTSIVTSLVNDILMPVIGLVAGGVDFTKLAITIPNFFGTGDQAVIAYGNFLQNIVNFLIVAFCIFLCIRFMNRFRRANAKPQQTEDKASAKKEDEQTAILQNILKELKKH